MVKAVQTLPLGRTPAAVCTHGALETIDLSARRVRSDAFEMRFPVHRGGATLKKRHTHTHPAAFLTLFHEKGE